MPLPNPAAPRPSVGPGVRGDGVCVDLASPPRLIGIGRGRVPGEGIYTYENETFWALHLYLDEGRFAVAGKWFPVEAGTISVSPHGATTAYETTKPLRHIFVHLEPCPAATGDCRRILSWVYPHSRHIEGAAQGIVAAMRVHRASVTWAEVKLWDALFGLATPVPKQAEPTAIHPAIARAVSWIEMHLPEPCNLDALATHAGVSATHLNRLFAETLGVTAMRFLRNRRMELARYLLGSTGMSIKEIAYQVGIPDIHAFNKLCKRHYAAPPSELRTSGVTGGGKESA